MCISVVALGASLALNAVFLFSTHPEDVIVLIIGQIISLLTLVSKSLAEFITVDL